ncbi:cytochrome c oxidase subunit 3 [Mycolicibacterium aichiense]|uniref:Probable cytochrome c oxidase subunit 3 n=1 Tax=Mycolicibacterium aichiense TaxID=1799 RepID=A0AAD1HPT5_9MYCO|nr:cytochrome c oxidase subunit 3 [Mycolicibacterium aichiense]MCV7018225.1 cytochrome c oxidase subunit 3 [Mycolicibacterium aichiense]BBX08709.1 cytochrome c oxidase subunit III [Mycolicibacterium aichiense]STZ82502.1 heme/copper-type cytochrome/quinol oxidase, subunit 3 [Mycolicibacterium aichiense]
MTAGAPTTAGRRIPGEQGTWVFLLGDMLVFAAFFATFMVERSKAPEVFDAARKTLHVNIGLVNTLVLLTSSLFVVAAIGGLRTGAREIAARALVIAAGCGVAFVALKVTEYVLLVRDGHTAGVNHFYLYYFILTGLHLLHVCIGILVLALMMTQTRRTELSATRLAVVEGGGCFWHLVDLLWIVLFPLLYLVS